MLLSNAAVSTNSGVRRAVRNFIQSICTPLARFAIRFDLTFEYVSTCLAKAFVEAADQECVKDGKKPNDSEIQLITGIYRKKVPALRMLDRAHDEVTPMTKIIGGWMADKFYQDSKGRPAELPIRSINTASFAGLIKEYSKDLGYRPALEMFSRAGVVDKTEYGTVMLANSLFLPENTSGQLVSGAASLRLHMETVNHNLAASIMGTERLLEGKRLSRYLKKSDAQEVLHKIKRIYEKAESQVTHVLDDTEVSPENLDLVLIGAGYYQFYDKQESE